MNKKQWSREVTPLELLRYLCDENGISMWELGSILEESVATAHGILEGDIEITPENARKLEKRFCMHEGTFSKL